MLHVVKYYERIFLPQSQWLPIKRSMRTQLIKMMEATGVPFKKLNKESNVKKRVLKHYFAQPDDYFYHSMGTAAWERMAAVCKYYQSIVVIEKKAFQH